MFLSSLVIITFESDKQKIRCNVCKNCYNCGVAGAENQHN